MNPPVILVVDDNPVNLKLVCEVLSFDGFGVLQAKDAEEAQVSIARQVPDLILMDIALPGIDGLELTRMLKREPITASVVIIALTAFAMKGDDEKAKEAGCDGYLTKPIDTRKLSAQVRDWLKIRSAVCESP